jgi:1,2-dihydroxy-3-keto-5-methylthiopentene dioxygenase
MPAHSQGAIMAVITLLDSGRIVRDPAQVAATLVAAGVTYEVWGTGRMPKDLRLRDLSETEKRAVLTAFDADIARLMRERGYQMADVVSLYPTTPDLDTMLAAFAKPHVHTDDEVRFVVQGRGVFELHPTQGEAISAELHPGDFITVPANYPHQFYLCEDRHITAIRLFTDRAGWVAHYV